jgi:hypothetical protein
MEPLSAVRHVEAVGPLGAPGVVVIFVVLPLGVVLVGLCVAIFRFRRKRDRLASSTAPATRAAIAGVTRSERTCWITSEVKGCERHHDEKPSRPRSQLRNPCWSASCTGCGKAYGENGELVHFDSVEHALSTTRANDWTVTGMSILCEVCAVASERIRSEGGTQTTVS